MNKVKVIKCSGKTYWYSNEIGNIFNVEEHDEEHFKLWSLPNLLLKTDVKIIE